MSTSGSSELPASPELPAPKKTKKNPRSWTEVVNNVENGVILHSKFKDRVGLSQQLTQNIGAVDLFSCGTPFTKMATLEKMCTPDDVLPTALLQSLNKIFNANREPTPMERLCNNTLAPSTTLDASDVFNVIRKCVRIKSYTLEAFHQELRGLDAISKDVATVESCKVASSSYHGLFQKLKESTSDLVSCEASGYPILGTFCCSVLEVLKKKYPDKNLWMAPQFTVWKTMKRGPDYSTDQAIFELEVDVAIGDVLALPIGDIQTLTRRVKLVYEYKPQVPGDLSDIEPNYLSEVILQAHYVHIEAKAKTLHCLTDLTDFHYFTFEKRDERLEITQYEYFHVDISDEKELEDHLAFLESTIT